MIPRNPPVGLSFVSSILVLTVKGNGLSSMLFSYVPVSTEGRKTRGNEPTFIPKRFLCPNNTRAMGGKTCSLQGELPFMLIRPPCA